MTKVQISWVPVIMNSMELLIMISIRQKEGEEDVQERGEDFELVPTKFIDIKLNDGTIYPTTDRVARVENTFSNFCCGISKVFYGENLPEPEDYYIVSAMVLAANNSKPRCRGDLVATGHPDCKRGFIVSVPGFVSSSLNNSSK